MDFEEVAYALNDVKEARGKIAKEQLLKACGEQVDGFKEVLKFANDPSFTTGLKLSKLNRDYNYIRGSNVTAEDIMAYLIDNNTGTSADCAYAQSFVDQYYADPIVYDMAVALVTKKLTIGCSIVTLNNVFGQDFIRRIGIMRGMLCPEDATGDYIATEKMDGNRRLIFVDKDGKVEIYTRSGKPDLGLVEIMDEAKHLPRGFVYDGELIAEGIFKDNLECRQVTASLANRDGVRTGLVHNLFDMVSFGDYFGTSKFPQHALIRKAALAKVTNDLDSVDMLLLHMKETLSYSAILVARIRDYIDGITSCMWLKHIRSLPVLGFAKNKTEGEALAKPIWEAMGEGVMLVESSSPYVVSPNPQSTLLKIKNVVEDVCVVCGTKEGDAGTKYEGKLGSLLVHTLKKYDGQVIYCYVGSGLSDIERDKYLNNPPLGSRVEVEHFGISTNQAGERSLNCPRIKRFVGDED